MRVWQAGSFTPGASWLADCWSADRVQPLPSLLQQ